MLADSTCVASVFVGSLPFYASRSHSTTLNFDGSTLARARRTGSLWPKDPSLISGVAYWSIQSHPGLGLQTVKIDTAS